MTKRHILYSLNRELRFLRADASDYYARLQGEFLFGLLRLGDVLDA